MIREMLICGSLTASITVALAVPARADEYDYISALDAHGVYYSSITNMIDIGKLACHDLRSHLPGPVVGAHIGSTGNWNRQEIVLIMSEASQHMCPEVLPWIQSQVHPPTDQ